MAWLSPMLRRALAGLAIASAAHAAPEPPAPDPPSVAGESDFAAPARRSAASGAGQVEWMLHKSADGSHPDAVEQCLVWLMNRARQNPAAEGVFLASVDDADVQSALGHFDVDTGVLQSEFAAIAPRPPAAFDARLWAAAARHSLSLIASDAQHHDGQFDAVTAAGFRYASMRGNVFSYTKTPLHGHAGFNVDWGGSDGTGMQSGRGHRMAIMSIDGDYTNVGIAALPDTSPATRVGPLVVTGNYANAANSYADHYDRFLVGTVWEDANANDRYDEGEGVPGVAVLPDAGSYFAVTSAGGGYAIPILEPGTLQVTFSGGGVATHAESLAIGATSELLDYVVPEPALLGSGIAAGIALTLLERFRRA